MTTETKTTFTEREHLYLKHSFENGEDFARAELLKDELTRMADVFKNTPAGEKEIRSHANTSAKNFRTALANKIKALSSEVRK